MSAAKFTVIDISRPIARGEPLYPGNAPVVLRRLKTFPKDGVVLSDLSLGLHTASHLDAPLHYVIGGKSVDKVSLDKCLGWCRVVNMETVAAIGEKELRRVRPQPGEIILFKTKNSRPSGHFQKDFAHLTVDGAKFLRRAKIRAVGTDGPSIRRFHLRPDTVHPSLLRAGILVYEGLNLSLAAPSRYFFVGLPLFIVKAEASPVRAVLIK